MQATSSWIIIDTESRHLLRNAAENPILDLSTAGEGFAIAEPAPKIQLPGGAAVEPAGVHKVVYSDIDFLGHVNNARYMVWAMDCLDPRLADTRCPKDVVINFNKEVRPGDTVELYRFQEQDTYYIEGKVEGRQSFIVKLEY